MTGLPTGRRGQVLAVALTVLVLAVLWLGIAAPALDWYAARGEYLQQQRVLAARMAGIAATAPALQRLADRGGAAPPAPLLFEGATDAIAGAALQQAVQDLAAKAGATVTSAESLPSEAVAGARRIGLHVTATAPWPVIVSLLEALAQATPRMLVDDLTLQQAPGAGPADARPLQAAFTVLAFHAGPGAAP